MSVSIRRVLTGKDLKTFIFLPEKIHRGHKNWLPPVYMDERVFFNPDKNHSFRDCDTLMLLAFREGKAVGRVMGIIHHGYNKVHNLRDARFGYLECPDDNEVAHSLLSGIACWAKERGMDRLVGPYGFSDKDVQGLLVEGFEYPPILDSACNYPYLVRLVEQEGFEKDVDCLISRYNLSTPLPEEYRQICERVENKNGYKLVEFVSRKDLKPYILPVLRMLNETYNNLYGFVKMEEDHMSDLAKRYLPVIDPRFVKVIENDGQLLGFLVGIPNFTPGLQRAKGYMLPFGWYHFFKSMKVATQLDLVMGGVLPKFQNRGLEIYMASSLISSCKKAGYKQIEVHLVLESNTRMLAELHHIGAIPIKRFRVFCKKID